MRFSTGEYNIPLAGTMEILTDAAAKQENWYKELEQHFSGPDGPDFCVLRFKTELYNLLVDWQEARGAL